MPLCCNCPCVATAAESYTKRWQQSSWKKDEGSAGDWKLAKGEWYGDEQADLGIQTPTDARFYTLWAEMDEEFVNKGKDLVLQVHGCATHCR